MTDNDHIEPNLLERWKTGLPVARAKLAAGPGGMTVQVCAACGAYAWMPLEVAGQVAALHDKACLAPKIAALADNLNDLRRQVIGSTHIILDHLGADDHGEEDDESDEDAVKP